MKSIRVMSERKEDHGRFNEAGDKEKGENDKEIDANETAKECSQANAEHGAHDFKAESHPHGQSDPRSRKLEKGDGVEKNGGKA